MTYEREKTSALVRRRGGARKSNVFTFDSPAVLISILRMVDVAVEI